MRAERTLIGFTLILSVIFLAVSCAKKHSSSSESNDNSTFTVSEIEQILDDGGVEEALLENRGR